VPELVLFEEDLKKDICFSKLMNTYNIPLLVKSRPLIENARDLFERLCDTYALPGEQSSWCLRRNTDGHWSNGAFYLIGDIPLKVSYLRARQRSLEVVTDLSEEQVLAVLD
tara:strand:+ start:92 stop:424 length:333 start_codon:yes stop_codon:yes gene_type:complete